MLVSGSNSNKNGFCTSDWVALLISSCIACHVYIPSENVCVNAVSTPPFTSEYLNLSLTPVKALPTRSQLAGNCSFANVETSVPAMLYMLFEINAQADAIKAEKSAFLFYKHWLEWDKDSALDEALADITNASVERKLSKVMMIGSILIQRCNSEVKKHIERAKKIINILKQCAR